MEARAGATLVADEARHPACVVPPPRSFWNECRECFRAINQDTSVRAVVIAGEGKHFSAGLDRTLRSQISRRFIHRSCYGQTNACSRNVDACTVTDTALVNELGADGDVGRRAFHMRATVTVSCLADRHSRDPTNSPWLIARVTLTICARSVCKNPSRRSRTATNPSLLPSRAPASAAALTSSLRATFATPARTPSSRSRCGGLRGPSQRGRRC